MGRARRAWRPSKQPSDLSIKLCTSTALENDSHPRPFDTLSTQQLRVVENLHRAPGHTSIHPSFVFSLSVGSVAFSHDASVNGSPPSPPYVFSADQPDDGGLAHVPRPPPAITTAGPLRARHFQPDVSQYREEMGGNATSGAGRSVDGAARSHESRLE